MASQQNGNSRSEHQLVSIRKVEANRRNALRSTGPKTPRGKAFSRRNAIKHGLSARHTPDFEVLKENPDAYYDLLNAFWEQYQPVGRAEEVEVERITLCHWRLKRAARFEDAANLVAQHNFENAQRVQKEINDCIERDKKEEGVILELQNAEKEIEATGEISNETKQRIFALEPWVEKLLWGHDQVYRERIEDLCSSGRFGTVSPQMRSLVLAKSTVRQTIIFLEEVRERKWAEALKAAVEQHSIPNSEALDRLLRYETATERSLTRALDRLDSLQRRRRGEPLLPPVRVH
jgi:hypothetical protein